MRIVIIGAGPAGLSVAEVVRAHDKQARITLISNEPHPPYSPPALADHFLTGRTDTLFWKGRNVCERLDIDFKKGVGVRRIDPGARAVELDDEKRVVYDKLVIASGSRLYAPVPGSDLPGIYNFKSLSAAKQLVERVRRAEARTALIVGAGFIGVEVAILLSELGVRVTLLEARDRVMPLTLDRETGEIVAAELIRRGVKLRLETKVALFAGDGSVEHVELDSGEVLQADAYVVATGVKPNIGFLNGAGIVSRWGIVVDDALRTSLADVYAAGDVAETRDRVTGERYVHAIFPNAVEQGRLVGLAVLGFDVHYRGAESMNSLKHVGLPVIAAGAREGNEELRLRNGSSLRKLFITGGRIVGFRLAGDIHGAGIYRALMLKRTDVTPLRKRLLDPTFGWPDLLSAAG